MNKETIFTNLKGIQDLIDVSRSTAERLVRFVKDHPDRYGQYAVAGKRYYIPAIIDASTYRQAFAEGLEDYVPDYNPKKIAEMVRVAS